MGFETGIRVKIDATLARRGAEQVKRAFASMKDAARRDMAIATRSVRGLGSAFGRIKSSILNIKSAMLGLGMGLVARKLVGEFAEFEDGLLGVGKTTGIAGAELAALGTGVQDIADTLPVATNELLSIAQAAGQLGVTGSDNIAKFTKTVGQLGLASDLAGEEAAMILARIMEITGTDVSDIDRMGATIVALGNNFAATEREIAEVTKRVAQGAAAFDITAGAALGMGTAMKALGLEAELSGTTTSKSLKAISTAIIRGGEEMEVMGALTGKTREELAKLLADSPERAFLALLEGLRRGNAEGRDYMTMLESIGLNGERLFLTLPTLAKGVDTVTKSLDMQATAWRENSALTAEVLVKASSFSSQMTLVRNRVDRAAVEIGRELAPTIVELTDSFSAWLTTIRETGQLERWSKMLGGAFKTAVNGAAGAFQFMARHATGLKVALGLLITVNVLAWAGRTAAGIALIVTEMKALGATAVWRMGGPAALAALAAYGSVKGIEIAKDVTDPDWRDRQKDRQAHWADIQARERERGPQPQHGSRPWWAKQDRMQAELDQRMNIRAQAGEPLVGPPAPGSDLVGHGLGAFRPEGEMSGADAIERVKEMAEEAAESVGTMGHAVKKVSDDLNEFPKTPFQELVESAKEGGTTMGAVFIEAVDGIASSIGQMVASGKANFASLARSIIAMMVEIQARAMILQAMGILGDWSAARGQTGGFNTVRSGPGGQTIPQGGIPPGGGGQLQYNQPQAQQVRAPEVNVNISTPAGTESSVQQQRGANGGLDLTVIVEQIEAGMAQNIGGGGGLAPALESQYGLNRVAGATR